MLLSRLSPEKDHANDDYIAVAKPSFQAGQGTTVTPGSRNGGSGARSVPQTSERATRRLPQIHHDPLLQR